MRDAQDSRGSLDPDRVCSGVGPGARRCLRGRGQRPRWWLLHHLRTVWVLVVLGLQYHGVSLRRGQPDRAGEAPRGPNGLRLVQRELVVGAGVQGCTPRPARPGVLPSK